MLRPLLFQTVAVALLALLVAPWPAAAQVSVDQGALQGLGADAPAASAAPKPHHPAPAHPRVVAKPGGKPGAKGHPRPAPKPVPPVIRAAPPAAAAIPPAVPVPPSHPVPPPPVPVSPDAPGAASAMSGGMRITFGPDRADLNAGEIAAIRSFADGLKADPGSAFAVDSFAAGSPDDPSTPRRLSLSRGLAVRAVLISEGVSSSRIFVRALGASGPTDAPADRVDIGRNTPAGHPVAPGTPVGGAVPAPAPP